MKNHKIKRHQQKKEGIAGMIVVGIDPGKEKHQAAVINEYGIQIGNSFTFRTNNKGYRVTLWKRVEKIIGECNPDKVIFAVETSCNLWITITDYLIKCGYKVVLVSPLTTYHSRPLIDHEYSKTDPKDAFLIGKNAY